MVGFLWKLRSLFLELDQRQPANQPVIVGNLDEVSGNYRRIILAETAKNANW